MEFLNCFICLSLNTMVWEHCQWTSCLCHSGWHSSVLSLRQDNEWIRKSCSKCVGGCPLSELWFGFLAEQQKCSLYFHSFQTTKNSKASQAEQQYITLEEVVLANLKAASRNRAIAGVPIIVSPAYCLASLSVLIHSYRYVHDNMLESRALNPPKGPQLT